MSSEDPLWQAITTSAVLGTQRRPYQQPETGGALGTALRAVHAARGIDGEACLLRDLAAAALYQRAGQLPSSGAPGGYTPCPLEEWPRCSQQAGNLLRIILNREHRFLLEEWVDLAVTHQRRVREEHLEALFAQPRAVAQIRAKVALAVGEHGRWLARLNPALRALCISVDEQHWQSGQRPERLAYLESLRERDPDAARALLAAGWNEETPADKSAFLAVLAEKLSLTDEPFLESVLDERRKETRQVAASLLARLPDSRFVTRMSERALRLVNLKPGLLRSTLEINLPEACDEALQRDGVNPRRVDTGAQQFGEKAGWLMQILALTPTGVWCAAWNRKPGQILELVRKHEWEDVVVQGWKESAIHNQDTEWLEAMMAYETRREQSQRLLDLFPRLPAVSKERLVIALLRDHPSLAHDQPAAVYLSACRHTWSGELTQAVATAICWALQRGDLPPWQWEKMLRDIAPSFHPALLENTVERIRGALQRRPGGVDPYVQNLISTLMFRAAMHRAFTTDDPPQEP